MPFADEQLIRVGIVADDLTGASDTAVQFVRAGWKTDLQLRAGVSTAAVVAVTTETRASRPHDAASAVASAVKQLREAGMTRLYKKIDSTLRGQIRAEVHAALDCWSRDAIAVVCPAFPAMGRTVVDGQLCVEGVPVSETSARTDPVTPVVESRIPALLDASHVAQKPGEHPRGLADRIKASGPLVVVDAASEDELLRVADAVVLLGAQAVSVGSAGLARHLAMLWNARRSPSIAELTTEKEADVSSAVRSQNAIVIVTSLQEAARRQVATLAAAGARRCEPSPADLIDDDAWAKWLGIVLEGFEEMDSTLLLTAPADRHRLLSAAIIPRRFADLTTRIIKEYGHRVSGVVVTGGDGARALVDALEATGIQLQGEVTTGVPIGRLVGGMADGLHVVTKAGGFGGAEILLQAVEAVRQRRHS